MSYFTAVDLKMKQIVGSLGALNAEVCLMSEAFAQGTLVFEVQGTWKGKIVVEGAINGSYNNLSIVQPSGVISFAGVNNDNQNGTYRTLIIAGYTHVRLRMSAYTSGTATVIMNAAPLVPTAFVWQLTPANLNGRMQIIDPDLHVADVMAGANTGVYGLRVFGGPTDPISDLPVHIDYDHHQIHEGEVFRWSVQVNSLASGVSKDIRLVVPDISLVGSNAVSRCPHFRFEASADLYGQLFLYEGTTFTGNGTQRTPIALERNGTYIPKLQVYEDPTVNVVGTQIWQGVNYANKNSAGSIESSLNEFVLKNNTSYLLRYTSQTPQLKVLLRMVWYEDLGV